MQAPELLQELVVVFGVAVVVVLALSRLRLPTIAGLIAAGALIGPSGLGWVRDTWRLEALAELGVALLLFGIGLEFSLERLRRLWKVLTLGGGLQVVLTLVAVVTVATALGFSPRKGVFLGFLVALSSTAIVLRALGERQETDAPHGRLIVGALIFQDLCVVPMMLAIPLLAGQEVGAASIAWVLARAALLVVATLVLGRVAVPPLLKAVAGTRRRELFLLAVLGLGAGVAWLSSLAGLSLALGAFMAGVALADSDYGYQALADMLPLRETFASLFFISIGMLFDVRVVGEHPLLVAGLLVGVLVGKSVLGGVGALVMRFPPRVAVLAGVGLAQIGEFSFVLANAGLQVGLLSAQERDLFVCMSVLTMAATPVALSFAPRLAAGVAHLRPLEALFGAHGPHRLEPEHEELSQHFIVAGLGTAGRMVVRALRASNLPHVVIELDPHVVAEARRRGEVMYYGDITSPEILERAGIHRARALVLLISDPEGSQRAVSAARRLSPDVPILVKVPRLRDIGDLHERGASDIVAGEFETALEAVTRVLHAGGVAEEAMNALLAGLRHEGVPEHGPVSGPRRMLGTMGGLRRGTATTCSHLEQLRYDVLPRTSGCEACLALHLRWHNLRMCLTCGHVGCCDASFGRHAMKHFEATGHPLMRSFEPGEHWGWCYVDALEIDPRPPPPPPMEPAPPSLHVS
ncbi:Kef-type potassium/proton antiporter (CPA2 family) [Archangium gephyra]|uniref:Glutathione-regulated potassium-efflux system protein KefC n=1 Tax=Archangium gephyra TaxID=48 RepID=A0AAC8QHV9_9BACT|nr:Glutathione-regulated potassium-efflux system protein KefC [Archangium gephyra]REG29599.1 Kef-type potassium/proton antiporter (CPA2 family) [Archangium gephyra]